MKSIALIGLAAGTTLALALTLTATPKAAAVPAAAPGEIDTLHSSLLFKIKHKNIANFYGVFKQFTGSFNIDQTDPAKSRLEITVDANSVDSRNSGRDKHIMNPDFLSTKEFPTITFKSTAFTKTTDKAYDVTGDLTFRGVTKPVIAKLTQTDDAGKGVEATFTIKRSDFGNTTMVGKGLSDEVSFIVSLEASEK